MKFSVIQPPYSMEYDNVEACFHKLLSMLDECDDSMDVIVLPEYSDVPGNIRNKKEYDAYVEKNNAYLLEKCKQTAVRCGATVFVNASYRTPDGLRNTTYAIDKSGTVVGKYFKAHPAPSEVRDGEHGGIGLDVGYSYEPAEPYTIEIDGVRYAFLTCYDFYFYEAFARIAKQKADVIIGCSLQRTDTHSALEIIGKFLSYQTNTYLVRSSVSLGEESTICGSSMIVAPNGDMLGNMKSNVGILSVEFDPKDKYYKPAGFGGKMKAHYEYIEEGRRPWNYRVGGASTAKPQAVMGYPRVCAHRGFNKVAPENSMPAFGAAVSLGAQEIEFDLWPTKDGEIVSCHDSTLERVSTGEGKVYERTYGELLEFDFGVKFGEGFKGLSVVTFEDILKKFACQTIMNIHVKPLPNTSEYPKEAMEKIVSLVRKYDCEKYVYFMLSEDSYIRQFKKYAPDIPVCVGHHPSKPWEIVDRAIALGAEKVQLFGQYYNQEMIDKAHAHGILCNVFYADDVEKAITLLDMGVDTILTNDYLKISNAVNEHLKRQ